MIKFFRHIRRSLINQNQMDLNYQPCNIMKYLTCFFLYAIVITSCSTENNNTNPENEDPELIPNIEYSIFPSDSPIPYGSDVNIELNITDATSATLNGEEVGLFDVITFTNVTQNFNVEITAINITESATINFIIQVAEAPVASQYFELIFTTENKYFSTNGTMNAPVNASTAQNSNLVPIIDITYGWEYIDQEPGFMDPITRSQLISGWTEYHEPWLSGAVQTQFYAPSISIAQFEAAIEDQSLIEVYFNDLGLELTQCNNIPNGSFVGDNFSETDIDRFRAYGFMNVESGKKGFIYIHGNQDNGWPLPILSLDTRVEIIREQ